MDVDLSNIGWTYSNFAGILAGFAFSGIFLLIENKKKEASEAICLLLISFTGLSLSAYLFANLGGVVVEATDTLSIEEAILRGVVASMVLSVTIMQMFLSVVFIFLLYGLPSQIIRFGKMIYYGSSMVVTIFMMRTVLRLHYNVGFRSPLTKNLILTYLISLTLILVVGRAFQKKRDELFKKNHFQMISSSYLLLLVLVLLYNKDIFFRGAIPIIMDYFIVVLFGVVTVFNHYCLDFRNRMMIQDENQGIGEEEGFEKKYG